MIAPSATTTPPNPKFPKSTETLPAKLAGGLEVMAGVEDWASSLSLSPPEVADGDMLVVVPEGAGLVSASALTRTASIT